MENYEILTKPNVENQTVYILGAKKGGTMGKIYNVNDNVSLRESYNVNDNVRKSNIKERARMVDNIADHLVDKFKAPDSRNFFCKCAWKLSEDDIWTAYEQAHGPKVKFPLKYFITLCQIKMTKMS